MIRLPQDTTLRVAIFTAVACSAATATYVLAEIEPAPIMVPVLTAPLLAVILWLQKDGQRTGICAVLDWGMFAWFAWPVVLPWYVFKSRGRRGWRLLVALIALIYSTSLTGFAVAWLAYWYG